MSQRNDYDAVVVGAGPNGLAAAITLARAGKSVVVIEAKETIGGGMRSAELTLPGFVHDICSAIHPLGVGSPFFNALPLADHGLEWIHSPAPLAHPFDDGTSAVLERSLSMTGSGLADDGYAYEKLMHPLVRDSDALMHALLGPLRWPKHPVALMRFGLNAIRSAQSLAENGFQSPGAKGLFAGLAAHAMVPLDYSATAAFGMVLGLLGHAVGWPFPRGGSQQIADAMATYLRSVGGEIITGMPVKSIGQLPPARVILLDVTPKQVVNISGDRLPERYLRRLRHYHYGPGVFKIDLALSGPIPWKSEDCTRAATVHLGSTIEEISASEKDVWKGRCSEKPFVILAQQSLFDTTRAPEGKHTVWAYCHVPHGSSQDMTDRIEAQIERYAPGFRDLILARHSMSPGQLEHYNANYIGGDISGGANVFSQLFSRPVLRFSPYTTPAKNIFICSSSTPPGGGVHGMCGYHAAQAALNGILS